MFYQYMILTKLEYCFGVVEALIASFYGSIDPLGEMGLPASRHPLDLHGVEMKRVRTQSISCTPMTASLISVDEGLIVRPMKDLVIVKVQSNSARQRSGYDAQHYLPQT